VTRRSSPYVIDAVEEFLATKQTRERKTLYAYTAILRGSERGTKKPLGLALAPHFQNRRFDSLTPHDVSLWFSQRVRGGAQDTKNRISKNSRAFLKFARERGYTSVDLAAAIPVFSAGGPRLEWLAWNEVHALLQAIPELRLRMAAAWLFYTGCRVSEATRAQQQDVRFRQGTGSYLWSIPKTKTHIPRLVWLPDGLKSYIEQSRENNRSRPEWPLLWDCEGRGFGRVENPAASITGRTINNALDAARGRCGFAFRVTAHVAKHSYCTNWIKAYGSDELAMVKLSRQVGTSVRVLRETYVHIDLSDDDWAHIKGFGSRTTA